MTPSYAQLRKDAPRLISAHPSLLWKKAQAERRFKKRHTFTLEADQRYVADLCLTKTCDLLHATRLAILSKRRFAALSKRRHIAMTVAYELSGLSSIVLGVKFNRGHDMILHAQSRVNSDRALRAQADKVSGAVKRELKRKK